MTSCAAGIVCLVILSVMFRDCRADCSGVTVLTALSHITRTLTSPGYPSFYGESLNCGWLLEAEYKTRHIQLHVAYLHLEGGAILSNECPYDNLSIYDGAGPSWSRRLAVLCGSSVVGDGYYNSSGPYMYLQFITDSSFSLTGFKLEYRAVQPRGSNHVPTTRPWSVTPTPSNSYHPSPLIKHTPIVVGGVGGCLLLFLVITTACTFYYRKKERLNPGTGCAGLATRRRGNHDERGDHQASDRGHTNQAFSIYTEPPPAYSSLLHAPPVPASNPSSLDPIPTEIIMAPPSYSESMMVTHPPGCLKVNDDVDPHQSVPAGPALPCTNGAPVGGTASTGPPGYSESMM